MIFYKRIFEPKTRTKFLLWPRKFYPIERLRLHSIQLGKEKPIMVKTSYCSGFQIGTIWLQKVLWKSDGWEKYISILEHEVVDENKMTPQEWLDYNTKPLEKKWYEVHLWGFNPDSE